MALPCFAADLGLPKWCTDAEFWKITWADSCKLLELQVVHLLLKFVDARCYSSS